jgi:hypothetical protein
VEISKKTSRHKVVKDSRCRVSTSHRFVNSFVLTHVSPTGLTHRIQTSGIKQEDAYPKGSTFEHTLHMKKSRILLRINAIWSRIPRVALLSILCKWRNLESYDTSIQYEVVSQGLHFWAYFANEESLNLMTHQCNMMWVWVLQMMGDSKTSKMQWSKKIENVLFCIQRMNSQNAR